MSDINTLPGLDKAAILFQVLGEALALSMFKNISEANIMKIRIRSRELQNVPVDLKKAIVEEYYFTMMSKQNNKSKETEDKLFSFLHELNDEQIYYLVNTEPHKVIALAVDQLDNTRQMNILDRFSTKDKHSVIMELGKLKEIPLEGVVNVAQELKNKTNFIPGPKEFTRGGAKSIATILNQMGTEEAEQYLEQIANEDAELYTEIKKYFLSFDDLLEMPEHMMKIYWRNPEIESEDLSKAVKGYDSSVVENILTYLPKRKQKMFEPFEQPLAKTEAEKAQLIFVALAKKMGENDELNLEELMQDADDMIE